MRCKFLAIRLLVQPKDSIYSLYVSSTSSNWHFVPAFIQSCVVTSFEQFDYFLADRTNGRTYATMLRTSVICLSVVCDVGLCIVVKRCVLEQKLQLTAL